MKYRNEIKHLMTPADRAALCARLSAVAQQDPHAGADGTYRIRSLYFDNWADKALREKLDGVNEREKFRIRCYNGDLSLIHLEKKSKRGGLGCKLSAPLTAEETQRIIDGDIDWMAVSGRALLIELYGKMRAQGLHPQTIVEYTRMPFVYAPGNVRVTLDYDLRTGLRSTDFLSPDCVTIPAGDSAIVLEVKWDEYLPDCIRKAVQLPGRRATAFSKYQVCRMYD